MECSICAKERSRRCVVLSQRDDQERFREGAFALAPFVHPFRSPTNYAQQLRTIQFARERRERILWVIAYDDFVQCAEGKTQVTQSDRQKCLQHSDKFTAGIPGFFPCVRDLPVRFTAEPYPGDPFKGVFTNARGILRGRG